LLERVPLDDAHRGYKPHEKSMSLERLATTCGDPFVPKIALASELFELEVGHKSASQLRPLSSLRFSTEALKRSGSIAGARTRRCRKTGRSSSATGFSFHTGRTQVIRSFVNHLIHHRGSGVYLRLNDIAIRGCMPFRRRGLENGMRNQREL